MAAAVRHYFSANARSISLKISEIIPILITIPSTSEFQPSLKLARILVLMLTRILVLVLVGFGRTNSYARLTLSVKTMLFPNTIIKIHKYVI